MPHLLAAAAATGLNSATFLSSPLGTLLQHITSVLAFPFFLVATFMIFRRLWRRSHKEAGVLFVMTVLVTVEMVDLAAIVPVANAGFALANGLYQLLSTL